MFLVSDENMIEITGELWEQTNCVICITTNGVVLKNGNLVMGAGCALEAKMRFPGIDKVLGWKVNTTGNYPFYIRTEVINSTNSIDLVSFPTKHNYRDKSDINLIRQSAIKLVELADQMNWKKIVIPKPGCGLGGLNWDDVKSELVNILDDRFYIISNV